MYVTYYFIIIWASWWCFLLCLIACRLKITDTTGDQCSARLVWSYYLILLIDTSFSSYSLCIWHFNLYLHISVCVQPMIKVKPCGVGFIPLSSNPQVKVANTCIKLLCDGLLLHYKPLQQSNTYIFCKRTYFAEWSLESETPFAWVSAHLRTVLRAQ